MPLVVHETDKLSDYATGYLTCTATEAVARARAAHDADPLTKALRAGVGKGGADPSSWQFWIHWPAAAGDPEFDALD